MEGARKQAWQRARCYAQVSHFDDFIFSYFLENLSATNRDGAGRNETAKIYAGLYGNATRSSDFDRIEILPANLIPLVGRLT